MDELQKIDLNLQEPVDNITKSSLLIQPPTNSAYDKDWYLSQKEQEKENKKKNRNVTNGSVFDCCNFLNSDWFCCFFCLQCNDDSNNSHSACCDCDGCDCNGCDCNGCDCDCSGCDCDCGGCDC